jgi:hypothetical protein
MAIYSSSKATIGTDEVVRCCITRDPAIVQDNIAAATKHPGSHNREIFLDGALIHGN